MKRILVVLFVLLFPVTVSATIYTDCHFESAPSSENSGGVYTCDTGTMTLYFASSMTGSVFDHITSGGWNNSGAAKFYTHNDGTNSYRQFDSNVSTWPAQTQNIRWLMKIEATGVLSGKWLPTGNLGGGAWDTYLGMAGSGSPCTQTTIVLSYDWTVGVLHEGNLSCPTYYELCNNPSTWWNEKIESCTETHTTSRFDWSNYVGQWVAIEQEKNFTTGTMAVYIWTQDGIYNGKIYSVNTTFNNASTRMSPIGAYLEGTMTNQYFIVDEVVYSDAYIGPPAGFTTGGSVGTISNITIGPGVSLR